MTGHTCGRVCIAGEFLGAIVSPHGLATQPWMRGEVGLGRKRLEVTGDLGADIVINAAEEDTVERVMEITSGRGAEDIVVDCGGTLSLLLQAMEMVRGGIYHAVGLGAGGSPRRPGDWSPIDENPVAHLSCIRFSAGVGGKAMLMATDESRVEWQPTNATFKGVRMIGIIGGSVGDVLELMQAGRTKTEPLVSRVFPLDRITKAFEMAANPDEAIKVMIKT